jgi:predicted ATPase
MPAFDPSEPGTPPDATPAAPTTRWQVRLLGAVQLHELGGPGRIERLPTRAEAALLARLALAPDDEWSRDAMVESLWPGVAPAVGRNRLRQTLAALRRRLVLAGAPGDLIGADRLHLRAQGLGCDVIELQAAARAGRGAAASRLDPGEFMPGHDDEWAEAQRRRVRALLDHDADAAALRPASALAAPAAARPGYLTRLIGAEDALRALQSRVAEQRLVTLLAPGGAGKTRLALELLDRLDAMPVAPPDGTPRPFEALVFVPLASCVERSAVVAAVARGLGLAADDEAAVTTALVHAAAAPSPDRARAGGRLLLVLDNTEQLAPEACAWIAALLAAARGLHLLATSRCPLGLDGEWRWPLAPLPSHTAAGAPGAAVALYLDRVGAIGAGGAPADADLGAIQALVQRLGGLPLAIELAATRAASHSPRQMLALLDHAAAASPASLDVDSPAPTPHLDLLQRPGTAVEPRHASMAAVLAWSWRLLDAPAQRLLAALAQIDGEASAASAAAMVEEPIARTVARLDALVAHGLLRLLPEGRAPRFALAEPVREFVRLHTPPALALRLRAALRRHLVAWAGHHATGDLAAVAAELPAVLSACAQATPDGVPEDGLRLALALRPYWDSDGHSARLRQALQAALTAADEARWRDPRSVPVVDPGLASDAHELLAYLHFEAGQVEQAGQQADAALAAAEVAGPLGARDPARRARALARRAWIALAAARVRHQPDVRQQALHAELDEALALARAAGDTEAEARVWQQLGAHAAEVRGDLPQAEACMAQAQALWQQRGDLRKAQARLRNRAQLWVRMGRAAEALPVLHEVERAALEAGDWLGRIDSLLSQASAERRLRHWSAALAADRAALLLAWQRWHRHALAYVLWGPGLALARLRRPQQAARLMAFAAVFWRSQYGVLAEHDLATMRRVRRLVRAQIGEVAARAEWARGEALALPEAVALALAD